MLAAKDDDGAGLVLAARLKDCGAFGCGTTFDGFEGIFRGTVDGGAALFFILDVIRYSMSCVEACGLLALLPHL